MKFSEKSKITFRLSKELREKLEEEARKRSITISAMLKVMISDFVSKRE